MLVVESKQHPWLDWVVVLPALAFVLWVWWQGMALEFPRPPWFIFFGLLLLGVIPPYLKRDYLLTAGVLTVVRSRAYTQVPLRMASFEQCVHWCYLQWPAGESMQQIKLKPSAGFAARLAEAVRQARAAAPDTVPTTATEATAFAAPGFLPPRWRLAWNIVWGVGVGTAFGFALEHMPIVLVLLLLILPFMARGTAYSLVLLAAERFWVIAPGREPYAIPLAALRSVVVEYGACLVTTADAAYPRFELDAYLNSALVKQLQRQVEPAPADQANR